MAHLSISLLGGFEVALDGQPITAFEYDKVRALLAYLAVEADRPHRREMLVGLLWSEHSEHKARQNLSQALFTLRQAIGDHEATPPILLISPQTLQFNQASDYALDVTTFSDLLAACQTHRHHWLESCAPCIERLQQAVALYRGDFLAGFSLGDSPAFEEWAVLQRERHHHLAIDSFRHLACHLEESGDYEAALQYAWREVELEPWQEEAHRQLMRLLTLNGERGAALTQYETCCRVLQAELGVEPAAETTALYEQIRDGILSRRAGEQESRGEEAGSAPLPCYASAPPYLHPPVPFVDREDELACLDEFFRTSLAGQGQVVFVTGEAGCGKTTLLQEFARRVQAAQPDLIVAGGNGNAQTGVGDPYLPFREILMMLTGDIEAMGAAGVINQTQVTRLGALLPLTSQILLDVGPDLIGTFAPGAALVKQAELFKQWLDGSILSRLRQRVARNGNTYPPPNRRQSDLFEQYTRLLRALSQHSPLLLLLDDLQWADLGSVSLLFHLGRRLEGCRILIVGAYRPVEVAIGLAEVQAKPGSKQDGQRHPLESVVNELKRLFGHITIDLCREDGSGRRFVNELLDTEPNRLGETFRQTLYQLTEGQPLFTVELLQEMREQGDLIRDQQGRWIEGAVLDWERLPARVEAVIAERIERLPEDLQEALTIASVEGETFTAEVIAQIQPVDERTLAHQLSNKLDRAHRLVQAQGIRWAKRRLSRFRFRHSLFQKYLYHSLGAAERMYLHEAVGRALETLYGQDTAEIAARLAWHFEEAGIIDKAVEYLDQAGEQAARISANEEAIAHFKRGLELLRTLPDSPERDRQELALQIALSMPLIAVKGYGSPVVGRAYARAWELCQQAGETAQLFRVLFSKHSFCGQQGEAREAYSIARQAFSLAEQAEDPVLVMLAHFMLGVSLLFLGKFALARAHLEQVMTFYDPQQHHNLVFRYGQDIGVSSLSCLCWALWSLGYPDQALRWSQETLALTQELDHPLTSAHSLGVATQAFHHFGQDMRMTQKLANACIRFSTEHGLSLWLAIGTIYHGWVLVEQGQVEAGLAQMRQGLTDYEATGAKLARPLFLAMLAEVYGKIGQTKEGLALLTEALVVANHSGERLYEAEIHRLKGELLLKTKTKAEAEAEACFWQAIKLARQQQAKSWELRATMSLCRLWRKQGKSAEARQTLAEIYNWFSEGFDTVDLQAAKALLAKL